MNLIESFSVDHTKIVPGIFVSRVDNVGEDFVTTYDVRMKRPNRDTPMDTASMHSLEHIIATYLRNRYDWKDRIVYWGPMGCLTGFYLIIKGKYNSEEIYSLIVDAFKSVISAESVPGATEISCGQYLLHNLIGAKFYANEFLTYLHDNKDNNYKFLLEMLNYIKNKVKLK